ncbi:tetratricopeptide repeat protein [Alloalcanivorax sp.]|uniref:tetratricopeptide repeat protein n=2 Tax=Gammaproteobacteria TaxID=1236 RepID=UPI00351554B1
MKRKWLWLAPLAVGVSISAVAQAPVPYEHRYYDDGYQVFVGNGNLPRAREVVENALYWRPADPVWLQRLAQVAGWQGDVELSLAAWLKLAESDNSDLAWQRVLELAPATFNNELALRARRRLLRNDPGNETLVALVAAEYERLGRPEEGIAFLDDWSERHPSPTVFEVLQRLAEQSGRDVQAIRYYRAFMDRYGPRPRMAWHAADLLWLRGERERAYQALRRDADGLSYDPNLTRRLAVMATELGDWPAALDDYQRLFAKGHASVGDGYRYLTLARYQAPERVASILRYLWQQSDDPRLAVSYLYALREDGDKRAMALFFEGLSEQERRAFYQDRGFLLVYADYLQWTGQPERARSVLRQALALAPGDVEVRMSWLWLLISLGDDSTLTGSLVRWHDQIAHDRRYLEVLAAAFMALDQPEQALRYEMVLLKGDPDNWRRLWAYSQALLAAGREDQAWPVLRRLWRNPPPADTIDDRNRPLYNEMRSALVARFENGDTQLRFQQRQWAATKPAERAQRAEWLAQWSLGVNAPELARLWYLRQQQWRPEGLPPGSALALATLEGDRLAIRELRDQHGDRLTAGERLEADNTLGRKRLAAAQLAEQQRHAPEVADQHPQQESLLLPAEENLAVNLEHRRQGALDVNSAEVSQTQPLGDRWGLRFKAQQHRFSSNDDAILAVNEREQRFSVTARREGRRLDTSLSAGHRDIFDYQRPDLTLAFAGELGRAWRWKGAYEWQAPADESSELLLAGDRTGAALSLSWSPVSNWQNGVSVARYDYQDLEDRDLGQGTRVSAQSTWRPWLSRFSPGLRVRHTRASFSGQRPLSGEIGVMRPGAETLPAVPQSYRETELALLLGSPDVHLRPHRIQAWGELGVTDNSISGTGFNTRVGAEGPLLGRDAWRFYLERGLNTGGADEDSYRAGFDYRFYY